MTCTSTLDPERQTRRQRRERSFGPGTAGGGIHNQADPMSTRRLPLRQIDHVPEQAAERGAQHVHDIERRSRRRTHDLGALNVERGGSGRG